MAFLFPFKKYLLVLMCCAAVSPLLSFTGSGQYAITKVADDSMNTDILYYVNQYRQSKGLAPLLMNPVISVEARKHSTDMALRKTAFGHDGFENRVRTITQQLGAMHRSAENVAYGSLTAKQVVDMWLKSPGHRKNIEGNYTTTGIGVAPSADGVLFFTQIFTAK